jgi:hypothetical protein
LHGSGDGLEPPAASGTHLETSEKKVPLFKLVAKHSLIKILIFKTLGRFIDHKKVEKTAICRLHPALAPHQVVTFFQCRNVLSHHHRIQWIGNEGLKKCAESGGGGGGGGSSGCVDETT